MNNAELPQTSMAGDGTPLTLEALQEQHNSLRTAFQIALVMLVILSTSLFVFFLREVSLARRQINELNQVVADYEKNVYPLVENFRAKLQVFTQSHPDFGPIYGRYFGTTNTLPPMPSPGQALPLSNSSPARLPPPGNR